MQSTMMDVPLSLNHLLERAGKLFTGNEIVSRLPDKTLRRHTFGQYYRRTRALGGFGAVREVCDWLLAARHLRRLWGIFFPPWVSGPSFSIWATVCCRRRRQSMWQNWCGW